MRTLAGLAFIILLESTACGWPPEVETLTCTSTADGSEQKSLLYTPPGDEPVPLLVAFHTWSGNYQQNESPYAEWCIAQGWAFLHPDSRGACNRPEACGSELALADVRAAIDSVRSRRAIDEKRIYAIGVSGGGMMALLVAARMPEVWGGVSAWVPVTDLKQWHADSLQRKNKYARDIEGVCGGPPGHSPGVDEQYAFRSPVTHLGKTVPAFGIDINTGIHDGFTGSVPIGHAIRAFNRIAEVKDRLADDSIAAMEGNRAVPVEWLFRGSEPLSATRPVLFRRTSGNARITVFDGGHEIVHEAGLTWLEAQARGAAPVWQVAPHEPLVLGAKAAASGR